MWRHGGSGSVWYDANALMACHLLLLGLVLVFLEFVLPLTARIVTLRVIATVGFFAIMIVDWRTANRWERERSSAHSYLSATSAST
jgi:hypothetical protein